MEQRSNDSPRDVERSPDYDPHSVQHSPHESPQNAEHNPHYGALADGMEVVVDDKKQAIESAAILPEENSRDVKHTYTRSMGGDAPEVLLRDDADKEVHHGNELRSPEVYEDESPLYHIHGGVPPGEEGNISASEAEPDGGAKKAVRRICGLPMATFWIIAIVCGLVVGAVVGAAVGATLSKKSKSQNSLNSTSNSTPAATPASATPATTTSSTPSATPSPVVDYRDTIHYNLTVWDEKNFTGRWQFMDSAGYYQLGFNASSYYWHCGSWTVGKTCSMAFCKDDEISALAWRGQDDRVTADIGAAIPVLPNRVKIVCGAQFENPQCSPVAVVTPSVYPSAPTLDSVTFNTQSSSR